MILVVFENKEVGDILGNSNAPTFNHLAARYGTIGNYTAVSHPSLPNYLALISGSTHAIDSDCTDCVAKGSNLADTLQGSGKTWKAYLEGLPYVGFTGAASGRYGKEHDPFLYFPQNHTPSRLRRIVPLTRFLPDLTHRRLPPFSLVVPDLCHDTHDCDINVGDTWLARFIKPLLRGAAPRNSVVFVIFDEGTSDVGGGGKVFAIALGPLVRPHSRMVAATNHYGLLRTIELGLRLRLLGHSAGARAITGIWR